MQTFTLNSKTTIVSTHLSVKERLNDLEAWRAEWLRNDALLKGRLKGLNPLEPADTEKAVQIAILRTRLRLHQVKSPLEISEEAIKEAGDYKQLHKALQSQYIQLSKAEKLLWLNNFLFIMTPRLRELNNKLNELSRYSQFGQQRNLLVGGPSGIGKTTYFDWLVSGNLPTLELEYTHVPIVKTEAPVSNKSPKALLRRLLLECGMASYKSTIDEEVLLNQVVMFFQNCHVVLVIIDEIEHITSHAIKRRLLELSNLLRGFSIPIICVSCQPDNWVNADGDVEISGRWNDHFPLQPYRGKQLDSLLAFLELLLPLSQPSNLYVRKIKGPKQSVVEGPAVLIEELTHGILRDIMILLMDASRRAIEENQPCITPALLKSTWEHVQRNVSSDSEESEE